MNKIAYRVFIVSGNNKTDKEWNENNILGFSTNVNLIIGDTIDLEDYEGDELNKKYYQLESSFETYGTLIYTIFAREFTIEMNDVFLYVEPCLKPSFLDFFND